MPVSPPQQELEHRSGNLSPVSPKPLHFPAPSNIPILEKQMEPTFNETLPASLAEPQTHLFATDGIGASDNTGTMLGQEGSAGVDEAQAVQGLIEAEHNPQIQSLPSFVSADGQHAADQRVTEPAVLSSPARGESFGFVNGTGDQPIQNTQDLQMQDVSHQAQTTGDGLVDAPSAAAQAANPSLPISTVDFQSLLDNLAKSPISASASEATPLLTSAVATPSLNIRSESETQTPVANASLPPRPPPQERPNIHPNFTSTDDIRAFHPHSQTNPLSTPTTLPSSANPATTSTSSQYANPSQPGGSSQSSPVASAFPTNGSGQNTIQDEDAPWSQELERLFEQYLSQEKKHEQERNWQRFPGGSRLFVGNLPTELISIKKAYGFVQFHDAETCRRVLDAEQGAILRGRKIHLEISHPQGSKESQDNSRENRGGRRRSRSPAHGRGSGNPRNVDRYVSGSGRASPPRDRDRHYRPGRSPSPRGYRGSKRGRSPDRYSDRRRSPPGRYRSRSRSPQRRSITGDDLALPRRLPGQAPDVQILITDDLDRMFISMIENAFRSAYLSVNTLPLPAHIFNNASLLAKHYAAERVQALVRITHQAITFNLISVLVFDYGTGVGSVSFNQYDNLAPAQAASLVAGKKALSATQQYQGPPANVPPPPHNGIQGWPAPPLPMPPAGQQGYPAYPPQPPASNVANLLSNLGAPPGIPPFPNPAGQRPPSSSGPSGPYGGRPPVPPPYAGHQQQYSGNSGSGGYGGRGPPQGYQATASQAPLPPPPSQQPPAQPDMAEIMAQLAKYNR